jgi:hypothetical protein
MPHIPQELKALFDLRGLKPLELRLGNGLLGFLKAVEEGVGPWFVVLFDSYGEVSLIFFQGEGDWRFWAGREQPTEKRRKELQYRLVSSS